MEHKLANSLNNRFNQGFALKGKMLNPVIVEAHANKFADVRAILREMVPKNELLPKFVGLPRISGLAEFAFNSFTQIEGFNMIGTVLTRDLLEEVAQMREVRKIYPDMIKWALGFPTVPEQGIFADSRR